MGQGGGVATIWAILAVGLWLGGVGTLGYQVYLWLKLGTWLPLNALVLLQLVGDSLLQAWAIDPSSWLGVHAILSWLPLSATLVLFASFCQVCGALAEDGGKPN